MTRQPSAPLVEPLDALLLKGDADPATRPVMTMVLVLDKVPEPVRLRAAFARAAAAVPRLRSRVVRTGWSLGQPQWVADDRFAVDDHLQEVTVLGARGLEEVLELAGTLSTASFDPARPLWDATLVTGLADGEAAVLLRAHHALTDGVRALEMLANLLDLEPEPPAAGSRATWSGSSWPRVQAVSGTLARRNQYALASTVSLVRTTTRPVASTVRGIAYVRSVGRTLGSAGATPSALLRDRSRVRRLLTLELRLDDLRRCAKSHGVTVNDVYLTGLLGGLRRYHLELGVPAGDTPLSLPVDVAGARPGTGGNHISMAVLAGPSSVTDPAERLVAVHELVAAKRAEPGLDAPQRLAPVLQHLPRWMTGVGLSAYGRRIDLQASNVVGPDFPVHLAGAQVLRFHAFGPLPGTPAMAVLVSHHGTCTIGFTLDPAAVEQPELLVRLTAESFDELLALGRDTEENQ